MNGPNIVEKVYAASRAAIKNYPCHASRASSIGDPCERRLVYERTSWDQKAPHDVALERIFAEGRVQEEAVLKELAAAGIAVIEQQAAFRVGRPSGIVTGHVDGVIAMAGATGPVAVPIEIKSMASNIWGGIFFRGPSVYAWEEVKEGFEARVWLRRYYAQLQMYALAKNSELAILLCKDKGSGALAQVDTPLDYDYAERMLQRAESVERYVAAGTYPDRIAFDDEVCSKCPFEALCLPDVVGKDPLTFLDDAVVLELLRRRDMTKAPRDLYEDADERVKDWAKAQDRTHMVVGGEYLVEVRKGKRATFVDVRRVSTIETAVSA